MATATITRFTITRDTANADVELDYTVNYDEFDVQSNIGYPRPTSSSGTTPIRTGTTALRATARSA